MMNVAILLYSYLVLRDGQDARYAAKAKRKQVYRGQVDKFDQQK